MPTLHCSLAEARKRRGWSQAQLAGKSGTSRAEVNAIETGRLVPSTVTGPHPTGYERVVRDHRALAATISSGWAQAGICVRPVLESRLHVRAVA